MIKIENVVLPSEEQWLAIIRGMRNPKNSWDKSEGNYRKVLCSKCDDCISFKREHWQDCKWCTVKHQCDSIEGFMVGPNDLELMNTLANGGPVHAKYRRMIPVYLDITAPLYWWKEFDTYKVGTVANSCSTMHKIADKEFTRDDFSFENVMPDVADVSYCLGRLNYARKIYLETRDKRYWYSMIQLLPSSYNQRRTAMLNYEVLVGMYHWRKDHKLDEWREFCKWIESLPYSELITGKKANE